MRAGRRWSFPRKVEIGLRLASEVAPKWPSRGDSPVQALLKMFAVFDSARMVLSPSKGSPLTLFVERLGLKETKNEQFVRLFFDTALYERFTTTRFSLTEYIDVIDASHPRFGRLIFVEYGYSNGGPEPTFYHSEDMRFADVLADLWGGYGGRIHVTISSGVHGATRSEFATFHPCTNPLYGTAASRMTRLAERHRRFASRQVPRSYMFYGPPGTGKSSFANGFAERVGGRCLKLDARSLSFVHARDMDFLLTNLRPEFLLIDDVDKADPGSALPTLLDVLERFKTEHPHVTVLMTANVVSGFDPGMLRPGRIDTFVEFRLPGPRARRELFERYGVAAPGRLVPATRGLSHDHVRELASSMVLEREGDVLATARTMRRLMAAAGTTAPAAAAAAPKAAT